MMPRQNLKMITEGIFFSLLNYCIEVYGNVWGLDSYDDQTRHSTAFHKEDNRKLQTIVNKVLRSLTGCDRETPVTVLHDQSNQLSVHQRCALYTLTSVQKAINMKQPDYSFSRFKPLNDHTNHQISRVEYKLSLSRGGYFYRGSEHYNQVPDQITQTSNKTVFKTAAKKWVLRNIPVLPP